MTGKKVSWPPAITGGWPYRNNWQAETKYMAESSCGPVVHETPEEALMRRVRYAAANPLKDKS